MTTLRKPSVKNKSPAREISVFRKRGNSHPSKVLLYLKDTPIPNPGDRKEFITLRFTFLPIERVVFQRNNGKTCIFVPKTMKEYPEVIQYEKSSPLIFVLDVIE